MPTVYIETSIVSYLKQKPSPSVVVAARQLLTHEWWHYQRNEYELVTSQYVLDEAAAGDPKLSAERLELLRDIPILPLDPEIAKLAGELVARAILPKKATIDAIHIAIAAHHRVDYLLTWNCKHIANARILPRVHQVLLELKVPIPVICTPEEMLGDDQSTDQQ